MTFENSERATHARRSSNFRALWDGREDRCPYWGDAHWSSPYDKGNYDKSEDLCHCEGLICGRSDNEDSEQWSADDESVEEESATELDSAHPIDDEDDEEPSENDPGETAPSMPRVPESSQSPSTYPKSVSEPSVFSPTLNASNDQSSYQHTMHARPWGSTVYDDELLANPCL
ncbi:hypothetical protein MMYC01_208899 [Madurella mycetomatis]|uniref:Uncharacterized protein n=1 Tax=Madurella mycetomatis TaxID=100816 RepID=A0A175VUR7_9PEZI|nr:hypothetical protein MMYC01_208899 [Madurella mycetomatis]